MSDYNIFSINGTTVRYFSNVHVAMKLDGPTLRNMAILGLLMFVAGGWLLFSETSPLPGAAILTTGIFLFLLGRRGVILLMEKEISQKSGEREE